MSIKRDYSKEFKELVKENKEELLTPYVHSRVKVEIRCKHNHTFKVAPRHYKIGSRCPKCLGLGSIQSKEKLEALVKEKGEELLTPYLHNKVKVEIRCKHNHIFKITPNNYKSGKGCPKCSKKGAEQAKERFEELLKERQEELLTPYTNSSTKVEIRCKHNHIFKITPNGYRRGYGCSQCAGTCPKQAKIKFESLIKERGEELLTSYTNAISKVKIRCKHNHVYKISPSNYKVGCGCPVCACNHGIKNLYILRDTLDKRIAKLGVSLNPWRRCEQVNKSSYGVYQGRHNFEIFKQWDLSFDQHRAVDIESEILRKFSDKKFYGAEEEPFDGSTEILLLSPEELEKEVLHFW